jgi:predicted amidohydrolase YtcJ
MPAASPFEASARRCVYRLYYVSFTPSQEASMSTRSSPGCAVGVQQGNRIVAGKKADFVLLAENPGKVDPMRITDITIIGTAFEGKRYHTGAGGAMRPVP